MLTRANLEYIINIWANYCNKSDGYFWKASDVNLYLKIQEEIKNFNHQVYLKSKPKTMSKQIKKYNLESKYLEMCKFIVENNLDGDDEYEQRLRSEEYHQKLNVIDNLIEEYVKR